MIIMRHLGDRVRTLLGHTEYIHRKLAAACRKVLLAEDDLKSQTGLAFPSDTKDSIIDKEEKLRTLDQELAKVNMPKEFQLVFSSYGAVHRHSTSSLLDRQNIPKKECESGIQSG